MNLFKVFANLFGAFFSSGGSPEGKSELKKIETELKNHTPSVYKNGFVQESVLESFYLLYINTKPIESILSETVTSSNVMCASSYSHKLLMTGFDTEARNIVESLSYEARKAEILASEDEEKAYEEQNKRIDRLFNILHQPEFTQINNIIGQLKQLSDICQYNYFSAIRLFDPGFTSETPADKIVIKDLPLNALEVVFMDLYYLVANFQLTNTIAKAVIALATLRRGIEAVNQEEILSCLKKISYVLRHILSPEILKQFVCLCKKDPNLILQIADYSSASLPGFITTLKTQFEVDKERLKTEIQDERVSAEIKTLFGDRDMETLEGYNMEQDAYLRENGVAPFVWLTPMQVLKTFVNIYVGDKIKSLLNDIVVEGYFNNPSYKSDFSAAVFAVLEISEKIKNFEESFGRGGANDTMLMRSYVRDGHTDPDFAKKLNQMVTQINLQAKKIIQEETTYLFNLTKFIGELLDDSKLISPINISNIKMLFASTRNRETVDMLDNKFADWKFFLDIMKNYAIIGDVG